MDRHLRHIQHHAVTGELRERRRRPSESDVEQLDEGVFLDGGQPHGCTCFSSTSRTTLRTRSRSTGLVMNPLAPADFTSCCDESCTSADTTITRAAGSISRSFSRTSSPYIPFITRSSMTIS